MTRMLKKAPSQDDFFDHAIGSGETSVFTVQIRGWDKPGQVSNTRYVRLPKEITSSLQLEAGKSVKWTEKDSKSLTITPLQEATVQGKVYRSANNLIVTVSKEMLAAGVLKPGEYVDFAMENGWLSVRKSEDEEMSAVKVWSDVKGSAHLVIPLAIVEEIGIKSGMFVLWQFDEKGLLIRFQKEDPHIVTVLEYGRDYPGQLSVSIPEGVGTWIKKYEYAALQVKEKKLYVSKEV